MNDANIGSPVVSAPVPGPKTKEEVLGLAAQDVDGFAGASGLRVGELASQNGKMQNWHIKFARSTARAMVMQVSCLPRSGYAAWLMKSNPNSAFVTIAIDSSQTDAWEKSRQIPQALQELRVVLHEVGHLRLHPQAFAQNRNDHFALPCNPAAEREAWWYSGFVRTVVMADHSSIVANRQIDDTPAVKLN